MLDSKLLADQLHRAIHGNAWHGPAVLELLDGVDVVKAFHTRIFGSHNIWEILQHLHFYNTHLVRTFVHDHPMPPEFGDDWPEPFAEAVEEDWNRFLDEFRTTSTAAVQAVGGFPSQRLSDIVPGRDHDFAFFLQGFVQHVLYHAGQVALLRKG